jgi:putative transport protein
MTWLIDLLHRNPELGLFVAVGVGFWLGNLKLRGFSLGSVTAALLVGLVIGNAGIEPSRDLRWGVFMLFLFANGYSVGPQFFQAVKRDGVKPMLLSVVVCASSLATAFALARLLHLTPGLAGGLFAGAVTQSAAIGTASSAVLDLALPAPERQLMVSQVAVADALCYLLGAIGVIWFCATFAPWLLRIDLKAEARALEAKLGVKSEDSGIFSASLRFAARAYRVENARDVAGRRIGDFERQMPGQAVYVVRIGRGDAILDATPDMVVAAGDVLVLYGHAATVLAVGTGVGGEVAAPELLDFPIEIVSVVVTHSAVCAQPISELRTLPETRGVTVRSLTRGGEAMPLMALSRLNRGDVVELVGPQTAVARAVKLLGYAIRPSAATPLSIVGLGIFIGGVIGAPALVLGQFPLTLTVSVGVLLAGLGAGWLRSVRPVMPTIPEPALQLMINLGLTAFVACAGMQAGPVFLDAVRQLGLQLLAAGIVVTLVPQVLALLVGRFILRMNPLLLLGALSGAQTYTGGLAAVQEKSGSRVAVLGYTVPYATSNFLLTMGGSLIVLLVVH